MDKFKKGAERFGNMNALDEGFVVESKKKDLLKQIESQASGMISVAKKYISMVETQKAKAISKATSIKSKSDIQDAVSFADRAFEIDFYRIN